MEWLRNRERVIWGKVCTQPPVCIVTIEIPHSYQKAEAAGHASGSLEGSSKDHTSHTFAEEKQPEGQSDSPSDGEYSVSSDDSASHGDPEALSEAETTKPLSMTALADFEKAQQQAGIIYISRIPPGMRPAKVKHLMSGYGKVGRVFLQQEGAYWLSPHLPTDNILRCTDPKRAYLRKKHTATKKVHYTEGWVEFESKHVARSVAEMLNAQPIGGKKGTRWRDDIWTMKYLPKFKWNMLTEQVGELTSIERVDGNVLKFYLAQEAAAHTARMRVELSQSRAEQRDYLKNVELARVLDKVSTGKLYPHKSLLRAYDSAPNGSGTMSRASRCLSQLRTSQQPNPRNSANKARPPLPSIGMMVH